MVLVTVICIILFALVPFLIVLGYRSEKKLWNNGVSESSGKPWIYFDTDSSGARGYKDDKGDFIWISWRKIDKEYLEYLRQKHWEEG